MKTLRHKIVSLFLAVLMLSSMVFGTGLTVSAATNVLVAWEFTEENVASLIDTETGTFSATTGTGVLSVSAEYESFMSGSLRAKTWAVGSYWEMAFSSQGQSGLKLTAAGRSSNTGPATFDVLYSLDGENWTQFAGFKYTQTQLKPIQFASYSDGALSAETGEILALPAEVDDKPIVYIRFKMNDESLGVNGNAVNNSSGISNLNNVIIYTGDEEPVAEVCEKVSASVASGEVELGTEVELSTKTEGAKIIYTLNGSAETEYTGAVKLDELPATIVAYATKDGFDNSASATFTYTAKDTEPDVPTPPIDEPTDVTKPAEPDDLSDPIPADGIPVGAVDIKEALASVGSTVTTVGQVAYIYGSNGKNLVNVILQDVIDGEVYQIQVYDRTNTYRIGDIVSVSGAVSQYHGVTQISGTVTTEFLGSSDTKFPPLTATIAQLNKYQDSYLSRYVKIENVTVSEYDAQSVTVSDSTGEIVIFKPADYPEGVTGGTVLKEITAAFSKFDASTQLRNASADDYVVDAAATPKCSGVKATPASGSKISIGDSITLATDTADAVIHYSFDGTDYSVYSAPITAESLPMTIYAYASKEGYDDSAVATFNYTEYVAPQPVDVADPVSDDMIPEGALNLKQALAQGTGSGVTVVGQLVYRYGSTGSINSSILQDVIDGEIVGFQLYDTTPDAQIGDIIKITGDLAAYGSVIQMQNVTNTEVIANAAPMAAQVVTVDELLANPDAYISEYVVLKNMTLGAYGDRGTTDITDSDGKTIGIYRSAPYPENASEGTVAKNVYAAFSRYNSTLQLRNGTSDDFDCGQFIYENYKYTLVSWAGSVAPTTTEVYGDYISDNDYKNELGVLTLSNGAVPANSNSTSMGSKGLGANMTEENPAYYQLKVDATKIGKLSLSYKMRGSNTAARDFDVYVSADGGKTFVKANSETMTMTEAGTLLNFSTALPATAAGVKDLLIRIQVASSFNIKGEEGKISASGNTYLQEVTLTGYPIIAPDSFPRIPSVSVKAGQVAYGTEIELYPYDDTVAQYSFDGENFETYTSASTVKLDTLPATLFVKAYDEANGTSSLIAQYKYEEFKCSTVKASPNGGAVRVDTILKLSCDTENATIYYCTDFDAETKTGTWQVYDSDAKLKLSTLPMSITAYAAREGYANSEFKTFNFTERTNENYMIKFGQIHSHTNYSDGAGTCDEAFKYASTEAKHVDFLAVTDHSNSFDNDVPASVLDGSMSSEWVEGHELADKYTSNDFVGIYGYEMTWSNGLGHINTYNTAGFQSRNQTAFKTFATSLQNYYDTLKTVTDSISQFNHPGTTFGDFEDFAHYDSDIDQLITIIEVGNGEGAIGSSGYFPSYEYYTRCLDRGWHIAPTNNQDNHKGVWGDANTGRTVALVDTFDRDNIYDAMRNYRIYATEDNDFEITYKLDDYIMGTILEKDAVGDTVTLTVDMKDPTDSAIGKVEVIVNGGLSIANQTINSNNAIATFELPSSYSYYYIRITQADGDIAVTAPVWVGEVEAVGISGISTTAPLAVRGEPLDVNLDLFNNEDVPLEIESIEFTIDGKVIHTADLAAAGLTSLDSFTAKTYSFNYIHDGIGDTQINAVVKATLRGVDKLYTTVLQLNYVIPEMVTKVIVDGTHLNDYVSGRYTGNMGNFQKIAGDQNVKVDVVLDEITPEMLESCALLIISTPSKGMYTDIPAMDFEPEFIEMVANYAKNGGTVIVCSMTDFYDTKGHLNAEQENKLLEAIGTSITVNSDTAVDDDKNGGQPYRLYLDDYNMDSPYLAGLVDGQVYSSYRGGTINPGNGDVIVYGHDTTYSTNWVDDEGNLLTKKDDATGLFYSDEVVKEKGDTVFLATEALPGGGRIFVSSGVFMSNFEVKAEMDNIWDLPYANKTIIENILKEVMVQLPVSPIADVRKANLKDVFHIQGYATAGTANENNKFFDAIYVQDDTAGITVFPFAELGLEIGTLVDITGYVDEYQGDKEIQVMSSKVLSNEPKHVYEPKLLTTAEAADYSKNGGLLTKVVGTVSDVELLNGVVSQFKVTDASGVPATVFIDGYILSGTTGKNEIASFVKDGATVEAVGLSYLHPEGSSDVSVPVLRVRNVDEIKLVDGPQPPVEEKITVVLADSIVDMTLEELKAFVPTMEGNNFIGWSTERDATEPNVDLNNFDSSVKVVYPVWEVIQTPEFTITVVDNGEAIELTIEQLKSYTPTREGYNFLGWATIADATEPNVDLNTLTETSGVKVVYPVWEKIETPVEFKINVVLDNTTLELTIEELKNYRPARDGYKFLGWATSATATEPDVDLSTLTEASGITTVYPVWEKVETPVEFKINVVLSSSMTLELTIDELKNYTPTRSGYNFLGWATTADATEPNVDLATLTETSGVTTVYPVWEKIETPVEFKVKVVLSDTSVIELTIDELKNYTPSKSGYKFLGWSTTANATEPNVDLSTLTENSGITTVYPVWEKIGEEPAPFKIKVVLVDGNVVEMTIEELKTYSPLREGYKFLGWATTADATEPNVDLNTLTEDSGITTVYPVWEKIGDEPAPFKIKVVLVNGSVVEMTIEELKAYSPLREGYEFLGWSTSENATEPNVDLSTLTENSGITTVYPVWKATSKPDDPGKPDNPDNPDDPEFVIAVLLPDGLQTMTIDQLKALNPVMDGYKFLGWSSDAKATTVDVDLEKLTKDSGIYAVYPVWEKIDNTTPGGNTPVVPSTGDDFTSLITYLMVMVGAAYVIICCSRREERRN